jgi:hypothetical protein
MWTDPGSVTLAHWDWTFAIFWHDIKALTCVGFFEPFPQKSVTLTFERTVVEASSEFRVQC